MKATVKINRNQQISAIDDRLYSSFIEHMGRAIYTGIYEPEHETADSQGFRKDVMELIKPLHVSHIRYPGGNFLSGYNWKDGIGPKEERPVRPELAWFALEPNQVGTDEFLQWCERMDVKPMLGVNLGTGTPQSAAELLEYVNGTLPTYYADLRRKNGHKDPYNVKLWCLGNEMDGPWQICGKTAKEYGRIACETAKMMKWTDPTVQLVACGSSNPDMPTYGEWEKTVLKHTAKYVDYLSLHQYFDNNSDDTPSFLAQSLKMEKNIRYISGLCRQAKEEQGLDHDIYLSFDEWNVWYHFRKRGVFPPEWTVGRAIDEEEYDNADALVVGCALNALIRNADSVKIACLAQLINVLAPIMTVPGGKAYVQTTYYPFLYASNYGRGTSLEAKVEVDSYSCAINDSVPYLDVSAVDCGDSVSLFLINRNEKESIFLNLNAEGYEAESAELWILDGCDTKKQAVDLSSPVEVPAFRWAMLRLNLK